MEGIILLILIGIAIVEFLVIGYFIGLEIFYFVMDKLYDWEKERDKKYRETFREWVEKGNRVLKTKKMTFVLTYYGSGGIGVYCNSEKCYEFNLSGDEIGRIISKEGFLFLLLLPLKKCWNKILGFNSFERISKKKFIDDLISSDSCVHSNIGSDDISHHVFSFDSVDIDKLPDWVTAELVAKKLEES